LKTLGTADELGCGQTPASPPLVSLPDALEALKREDGQQVGDETDCLLVIDVQNDFCPGGALAVDGGDTVVPTVNSLATHFSNVVYSQDWHPKGHLSFASSHEGKSPYDSIATEYGQQTLWPDHCVQDDSGSAWHKGLVVPPDAVVCRKGHNPKIDSYSAFYENDHVTSTGLEAHLKEKGVKRVVVVGLAYDFCVSYTAVDAKLKGDFDVCLVRDATEAVGMPGTVEAADERLREAGVTVVRVR